MNFTVYKHIFPNGKVYIGITNRNPNMRFRKDGKGYINCPKMYNAIQKYGWENVEHEILLTNLTKEEAEQKEIELIAKYKSNQKEYGYNIANGGNYKGKCSDETKKKIREKNMSNGTLFQKNRTPWNKGIPQSKEALEKNRQSHIGKKASDETRRKMSLAQKGRKLSKEAIKKALETKRKKYPNGWITLEVRKQIALKKTGIKQSNETIQKRKNTIKNKYDNGYINKLKGKPNYKKRIKINQYDLDGNYVKTWNSITEASNYYQISSGNICMCCNGKRNKTHNYIWKYAE